MNKYIFALAALSALTAPALADEADDGTAVIIVTGQKATDEAEARVLATPGGADLVRHADYADRALVSLRDTLAFSPGIYSQPRYGQEVRLSIRGSGLSRGFHMRGLTLLQDGVPINLADDNGDFQELEPIFFDHLEVYRGANALRFGSGTLGGAINGVTPRGRDASGPYLRLDSGSFGLARLLASYGGASGPSDYWAGLSIDTANGDRAHAERHSLRFQGNVGLAVSDRVSTRFYASINHIRQQLPGALTATQALTAPETGNFAGDQRRDIDSARLQNRTSIDWGTTRLELGLFANFKDLYHPIFQVIDQKSTDAGAFGRLDHEAGPLAFTLGGEVRRGWMRARQFVNVDGARGALTFDADQDARTATLYGEARLKPVTAVTLIAGAVYTDGFRKRHVRASTGEDGRLSFSEVSPKFGLIVEPAADIQLFANLSRSAELPGYGEVFQTVNSVSRFIADIRPQSAWTAEIGTRGRVGMLRWDIAAYRATLDGEMLQYSLSSAIPAATFNAGRTRHSGIEAALSLEPTPWLRLRQVWQYADFHFVDDAQFGNNRLPVVPRNLLRTELRLGTDALHAAPNVEWVPQGPYADYANSLRTPGYALLGLSAGAMVTEGIALFLDMRNILDKKAIGDVSAALSANAGSAIFYPVERRAIYGGVRMRL